MIKIALDVSPLSGQSRFRGVGMYIKKLLESLEKSSNLEVIRFDNGRIPPKADLVHYPYFFPFKFSLPFNLNQDFVVTVHDLIPLIFPEKYPPGIKGKFVFEIQKIFLKRAKRIITDSETSKRDIERFLGYPKNRVDVVYLAPANKVKKINDKKILSEAIKKYHLPEKFVLYIGDVNYNKNLPGLLKACRMVKVPLVVVGKQATQKDFDADHIENQSLVEFLKMAEGATDVLRLGFVEENELSALYSLASCFCMPSFYEGFGLQVLEAMSCECPVVASNVSSLPEVAGEAAILVDPQSVDSIAGGIEKILKNDELKIKLIKRGLEQIKKFSWEKVGRETEESYYKALNRRLTTKT